MNVRIKSIKTSLAATPKDLPKSRSLGAQMVQGKPLDCLPRPAA